MNTYTCHGVNCLTASPTSCVTYDGPSNPTLGYYTGMPLGQVIDKLSQITGGGGTITSQVITLSGNGLIYSFTTPNTLGAITVSVQPTSTDAQGISTTQIGGGNIIITYDIAPPTGTNNLSYTIIKLS